MLVRPQLPLLRLLDLMKQLCLDAFKLSNLVLLLCAHLLNQTDLVLVRGLGGEQLATARLFLQTPSVLNDLLRQLHLDVLVREFLVNLLLDFGFSDYPALSFLPSVLQIQAINCVLDLIPVSVVLLPPY